MLTMKIEVWADVVCPWCYIGKRRLQSALAERGIADEVEIVHRAFQLDPTASTTTAPTIDHLAAKYGVSRDEALAMMSNVTEVAAGEGLEYHLDRTMTGNTRNAHRLVVIEKGRVVETGTHDELMSDPDGVFHKLVTMQTDLNRITYIGG